MFKFGVVLYLAFIILAFPQKGNATEQKGFVSTEADTAQLSQYFSVARKLSKTNSDSSFIYFNKALRIANKVIQESKYSNKEINRIKEEKANLLNEIGSYYYEKKFDYDSALNYYSLALGVFQELADKESDKEKKNAFLSLIANTKLTVGVVYFNKDDVTNSTKFYNSALETGILLNDSIVESKALLNLGMVYNNQGKYDEAIKNYFTAIEIFEHFGDKKGIAICHLSIGNILRKQNTLEKAIDSYKKALEIFKETNDKRGKCACYNNLGISYVGLEDYEQGLDYYNKALDIYIESNDERNVSSTYSNIAALYEVKEEYDKAIEYVLKSLEIGKKNNYLRSLTGAYINLAAVYLSKIENRPEGVATDTSLLDTIIKYAGKGYDLADSLQLIQEKASTLPILKGAYFLSKNYRKAFEVADELLDLNDSIYNNEKTQIIANAENNYEAAKKEQQIIQQKHELEDQKLELSNARLLRNFLAVTLFFLIIVILFIYYYYKQKNKANLVLDEKNRLIEKQNEEILAQKEELLLTNHQLTELLRFKEKMTGMIVHDLKNPLNNILNSQEIDDEYFREQLIKQSGYDMLNLIQNILDVYKLEEAKMKIYKEEINIMQILKECVLELALYISEKDLKIIYPQEEIPHIRADRKLVKRIFSNLLSNAVKYAPIGSKIPIRWKRMKESEIWFGLNNQGPAIPRQQQEAIFRSFGQYESRDIGIASSTGLGLSFCKMAVELHHGKIGVISEDSGTEFWFTLPM